MKKKLYRIALISSPILALYGVTPMYIINKIEFSFFLTMLLILSVNIFIFWNIHIAILSSINHNSWKRYVLCFLLPFMAHFAFVLIGLIFEFKPPNYNFLHPFLAGIAINTIIIILTNSIIFQFQKESAEIEIERLKVSNLEAEKQVLIQQLQPHFLFNALSNLKSLIKENADVAEDYTVKLSDFLRYSVEAHQNELISLEKELAFTQDYIELQKIRFDDAFTYKIDIPATALLYEIPILALQTLVENIFKHNHLTEKNPLSFSIICTGDTLQIWNKKISVKLPERNSTGISNLKKRYQLTLHQPILVEENATEFKVTIPLKKV